MDIWSSADDLVLRLRYTKYDLFLFAVTLVSVFVFSFMYTHIPAFWVFWASICCIGPVLFVIMFSISRGAYVRADPALGRITYRWRSGMLWCSSGEGALNRSTLEIRPLDFTDRCLFWGRKHCWAAVWCVSGHTMAIIVGNDISELHNYVSQFPDAIRKQCRIIDSAMIV